MLAAATGVAARVGSVVQSAPTAPAPQTPAAQAPAQPPAAPGSAGRATTPQAPVTPPGPPVQVPAEKREGGYTTLFNRKDLTDWKIGGAEASFKVQDGAIVANGVSGGAHLYYDGPFKNHMFRNFDLKLDVMAKNRSNGGIYVMTDFQPTGFPTKGFEIQLNNSHTDRVRTGSLYHVVDLSNIPAKDDEWFSMQIVVRELTITIFVKGEQVLQWKQPADWTTNYDTAERKIRPGTIAFQAHDPNSFTYYTNVRMKSFD
jgi:hypothetical protein